MLEALAVAARTVLTVPLLTLGVWGDENAPMSVVEMHKAGHAVSVMIIPQAGITSKVAALHRAG